MGHTVDNSTGMDIGEHSVSRTRLGRYSRYGRERPQTPTTAIDLAWASLGASSAECRKCLDAASQSGDSNFQFIRARLLLEAGVYITGD